MAAGLCPSLLEASGATARERRLYVSLYVDRHSHDLQGQVKINNYSMWNQSYKNLKYRADY